MSEKHILIVTGELVPFHYGGIGTQFKSLATFLKRQGHQVYLLTRKPENYDETLYKSHYGEIPLFFVDAPPTSTGPPQHFAYAAEVARRFDEIYPEIRPDLVIFADFDAEGLFLLLRSGTGAYGDTDFLLTINGMNYEVISVYEGGGEGVSQSAMDSPDIRTLLAMEDLCVLLAERIATPTACAWEEIRQRLGISKTARIIPNLVDLDLFRPEKTGIQGDPQEQPIYEEISSCDRASGEEEMQGDLQDALVLFVGRLDRIKGADLLLKAYFEIADQMHPAVPRIIFIGRDCYWNEYGSTFLEYWENRIPEKYAGAISFLGQVSHDSIRDYFKKATVAVFPSRWEPFGIVCLEALSMGCPVVVSKGTGLEEVLGPALSEFVVPVTEDIQPLAQKILFLLHAGHHISSEKLRERALEVVRQAEKGWLDFLRDIGRKKQMKVSPVRPLCGSMHQLLTSLEDLWRGIAHLQVYFYHQGQYKESDSLRVSYPGLRWTTLKIPLPDGTGESPLRLDPTDAPGTVRIKQIILLDESGNEIWRADGANRFRGCSAGGNDPWSFRNNCLVIAAGTNDPQIFLDCPATDRPVEMQVILFAGDD